MVRAKRVVASIIIIGSIAAVLLLLRDERGGAGGRIANAPAARPGAPKAELAPGPELVRSLAGRGVVVPVFWRYRSPDGIDTRLEAGVPALLSVETIEGPVWPPYAEWIGIGVQRRAIGRVYRAKSTGSSSGR